MSVVPSFGDKSYAQAVTGFASSDKKTAEEDSLDVGKIGEVMRKFVQTYSPQFCLERNGTGAIDPVELLIKRTLRPDAQAVVPYFATPEEEAKCLVKNLLCFVMESDVMQYCDQKLQSLPKAFKKNIEAKKEEFKKAIASSLYEEARVIAAEILLLSDKAISKMPNKQLKEAEYSSFKRKCSLYYLLLTGVDINSVSHEMAEGGASQYLESYNILKWLIATANRVPSELDQTNYLKEKEKILPKEKIESNKATSSQEPKIKFDDPTKTEPSSVNDTQKKKQTNPQAKTEERVVTWSNKFFRSHPVWMIILSLFSFGVVPLFGLFFRERITVASSLKTKA